VKQQRPQTSYSRQNVFMKLNSFHKVNKSDGDWGEKLTFQTTQVPSQVKYTQPEMKNKPYDYIL